MRKCFLIFLVSFFLLNSIGIMSCSTDEIDKSALVEWVQDGDTFRTSQDEWIRLADIDTPEEDENITAYWESKNYMIATIYDKKVYLDIDDKYIYDYEGNGSRLVCVVYVDFNQTHYMNMNKVLLEEDLAVLWDHDNQFDPFTWTKFVKKSAISKPPTASFTYNPLNPEVNETITFDASLSNDPDGSIVSYLWDFGDGDVSNSIIVTHSYNQEGLYNVTLTVVDDAGLLDSTTVTFSDSIPEFPSWIILPLFLIGTFAVIEFRKKLKK